MFKQADVMAKILIGWMPLLIKQGCCRAVAAAMRKYDRSRYGTVKHDQIAILLHEDALAALRVAFRKTGKPKFRTALDILEGPAVYEMPVSDGRH
jgi:hypothetical protein